MTLPTPFRPALIVVDVQEDFCPPNGSLAVAGGRDIIPTINDLLTLPFTLKVATKDHHPQDHVSFASNHGAAPFETTFTVVNPANPAETYETRLWPDHCVVGTPGNALAAELDPTHQLAHVVLKGIDPRVEMYSAFRAPLHDPPLASAVSDLAERLATAEVTDVFVVGLAGDYCVKSTAVDSAQLGWRTYIIEEGTRSVGGAEGWAATVPEIEKKGVKVVRLDGEEVGWVKALRS